MENYTLDQYLTLDIKHTDKTKKAEKVLIDGYNLLKDHFNNVEISFQVFFWNSSKEYEFNRGCITVDCGNFKLFLSKNYREPHFNISFSGNNFYNWYRWDSRYKDAIVPNNIGVVTIKKVTEWVCYYAIAQTIIEETQSKKEANFEAFYAKIEGLPIEWNKDQKSGRWEKGGLIYTFAFQDTYVSERIELSYKVSNNLESFIKLSDNKYINESKY